MARTKITARPPTPEQRKAAQDRAAAALADGKRPQKRSLKAVKSTPFVRKSTLQAAGGIKKPHRFKPGTVAGREVTKLQKTTENLVPKASFLRVVRQGVGETQSTTVYRISEGAKEALQQATEDYLIEYFRSADIVRESAGPHPMDTLMVRHMKVANDVAAIFPGRCATDHSIKRRRALQDKYDIDKAARNAKNAERKAKAAQKAKKFIADDARRRKAAQETEDESDDEETTDGNGGDGVQGSNSNNEQQQGDEDEANEDEEEEAPLPQALPKKRGFVIKGKKPRRAPVAVQAAANQQSVSDDTM